MNVKTCILVVVAFTTITHADFRRVFLGNIDLAGLVPPTGPQKGDLLILHDTESPLLDSDQNPIGYLPVLFRRPVGNMIREGLKITVEVEHLYQTPQPGKFVRVTVWADTEDLSQIHPLIYHIPIHSEDELSDYE